MAELAATRVTTAKAKEAKRTSNRRRRAIALSIVLGAILIIVLVAGLTMPPELYASDYSQKQQAPNAVHWFGTDFLGHDMFCFSIRGLSCCFTLPR